LVTCGLTRVTRGNTEEEIKMEKLNFEQMKKEGWLYSNTERLEEIREILISGKETDVADLGRKSLNKIASILLRDGYEQDTESIGGSDFTIWGLDEDGNYPNNVKYIQLDYLNELIAFLKAENAIPIVVLNFTPHDINLGEIKIPSTGNARVSETISVVDTLDNIDVIDYRLGGVVDMIKSIDIINKKLGAVTGLPDKKDKTFLIVSLMVAQALPLRDDLLIPGELVRDGEGKIIGCKNLCKL
jgi:hypothetical protein